MALCRILRRVHLHVTGFVDRDVAVAPAGDFVQLARLVHAPRACRRGGGCDRHGASVGHSAHERDDKRLSVVERAIFSADARVFYEDEMAPEVRCDATRSPKARHETDRAETGDRRPRQETIDDRMSERVPAIRVLLLPKDTNAYGTIFGGVILAHIDLASAIEARKVAAHRFVTKAMREVEFHEPVYVGDIVDFYTETVRVGRTSVTVRVRGRGRAMGKSAV